MGFIERDSKIGKGLDTVDKYSNIAGWALALGPAAIYIAAAPVLGPVALTTLAGWHTAGMAGVALDNGMRPAARDIIYKDNGKQTQKSGSLFLFGQSPKQSLKATG